MESHEEDIEMRDRPEEADGRHPMYSDDQALMRLGKKPMLKVGVLCSLEGMLRSAMYSVHLASWLSSAFLARF